MDFGVVVCLSLKDFILLYDSLFELGFVRSLESSVFSGLPKCASKGGIFVTLLVISLIDSTISDNSAMVVLSHMGLIFIVSSLRFNVCIRRSTIPEARWSWVGEKMSLVFFSLQ